MFKKEDVAYARALKKVFDEATFALQRREGLAFLSVIRFVDELADKIEQSIVKPEVKIEPIQEKKKKGKK
jgi:hypothetical protein